MFWAKAMSGTEEPVTVSSPVCKPGFCSGAGRFPASSQVGPLAASPARGRKQESCRPPAEAPGPGAAALEAAAPEQPVAAGRGGCGGGRQQSQSSCRDGQGNEMVDSRQGERFQSRKGEGGRGGSIFTSAVRFHFSVLSVIATALVGSAGRRRGSAC